MHPLPDEPTVTEYWAVGEDENKYYIAIQGREAHKHFEALRDVFPGDHSREMPQGIAATLCEALRAMIEHATLDPGELPNRVLADMSSAINLTMCHEGYMLEYAASGYVCISLFKREEDKGLFTTRRAQA